MTRSPMILTAAVGLLCLGAPSMALALAPPSMTQGVVTLLYGGGANNTSSSDGALSLTIPSHGIVAQSSLTLGTVGSGAGVYAYSDQASPLLYNTTANAWSYLGYQFSISGYPGTVVVDFSGNTGVAIHGNLDAVVAQVNLQGYDAYYNLVNIDVASLQCNNYNAHTCDSTVQTPSSYLQTLLPSSTNGTYSLPFDFKATLSTNKVYTVYLQAQLTSTQCAAGSTCDGTAFADPLIQIDPSTGGEGPYTVNLSPGVTNGLGPFSVPEPTSWALMLTGFGLVGAAARRRPRRVFATGAR